MKLIDPGIGELSDRLTILALKILFGQQGGREVKHFERERAAILAKIRARDLNGAWFDSYTALAAVNAALWHAEDDIREWRKQLKPMPPDESGISSPGSGYAAAVAPEIVDLSFRIQALNDERSKLISLINKETGDTDGPEKAFTS